MKYKWVGNIILFTGWTYLHRNFAKKKTSSFSLCDNPFIMLMLQTEGCFRHPSAKFHFVWRRTENRLPEIEKSFGRD